MSMRPGEDSGRAKGNPFLNPALAGSYEQWYAEAGRSADVLEKTLLGRMLRAFPDARSVLEVGCGTGHFTRWMAEKGLDAMGLDVSEPMLAEARRYGGATYLCCNATKLPFRERAYDLVALITTLEFVHDPDRALAEAVRVARRGIVLGVLNRYSLLGLRRRLSGESLWRSARFFGPGELEALVRRAAGRRLRGLHWRTTLWPIPGVHDLPLPWGGFIGMAARLSEEPEQ